MKLNNKGFTLIELLAVLVIMIAITAIAFPSISASIERSKNKQNNSIKKVIESSAELYFSDHKNTIQGNCFVTVEELKNQNYLTDEEAKDADGKSLSQHHVVRRDNKLEYDGNTSGVTKCKPQTTTEDNEDTNPTTTPSLTFENGTGGGIYEKDNKYYLDSNYSKEMTSTNNPIDIPQSSTKVFKGYYQAQTGTLDDEAVKVTCDKALTIGNKVSWQNDGTAKLQNTKSAQICHFPDNDHSNFPSDLTGYYVMGRDFGMQGTVIKFTSSTIKNDVTGKNYWHEYEAQTLIINSDGYMINKPTYSKKLIAIWE